ncbi:hypothetical protein [Haloplasma contractile]|uniref:Uncharacterized protein n=1 Tax=Haloplasma contractile SSD-17B TaxID=1033810 RepID=U2EBX5_9MOLU|nr:hypothetical protein [Haloplasma contractile]ERJ12301.1 hypothetical protein HLPCO_001828 [Haloplasma contractile SSD-17B]
MNDEILNIIELIVFRNVSCVKDENIMHVFINEQLTIKTEKRSNEFIIYFELDTDILNFYPLKLSEFNSKNKFKELFQTIFSSAYHISTHEKYQNKQKVI